MFSFLPPFTSIETTNSFTSLIEAFQIFHSTVQTPLYRSRGEERGGHTHCIFHYTVKGHGEFIYKGKAYKTNPGQGFFNIINQHSCGYGYPKGETEPWEFVVISFQGGNVRDLTCELNEKQIIYDIAPKAFSQLCYSLFYQYHGARFTFLPNLISCVTQKETEQSKLSQSFKEILQQEVMTNPTISAIAKKIGVSREHLQRQFVLENGISPAKYLAAKRFETLCSMLSSNLSEKDIADRMHFSSLGAMSSFFKKHSLVTPTQYRKNKYLLP